MSHVQLLLAHCRTELDLVSQCFDWAAEKSLFYIDIDAELHQWHICGFSLAEQGSAQVVKIRAVTHGGYYPL